MRYSLYEGFDAGGATSASTTGSYADLKVQAICQQVPTLDANRNTFITTLQDMVTKLATTSSTVGVAETLATLNKQMVRINDVSDSLNAISGFFNDSSLTSTNNIQIITDVLNSVKNTPSLATYVTATKSILDKSETVISKLYSVSNKVDVIRNKLVKLREHRQRVRHASTHVLSSTTAP